MPDDLSAVAAAADYRAAAAECDVITAALVDEIAGLMALIERLGDQRLRLAAHRQIAGLRERLRLAGRQAGSSRH